MTFVEKRLRRLFFMSWIFIFFITMIKSCLPPFTYFFGCSCYLEYYLSRLICSNYCVECFRSKNSVRWCGFHIIFILTFHFLNCLHVTIDTVLPQFSWLLSQNNTFSFLKLYFMLKLIVSFRVYIVYKFKGVK